MNPLEEWTIVLNTKKPDEKKDFVINLTVNGQETATELVP